MNAILYYLSLPFIYLVSLLPFRLLYLLSDLLFVLVFHLIGYRKEVVRNNLRNAFPEKGEEEIRQISRKFYRSFCDLTLESLKNLTISAAGLKQFILFEDTSLFQKYKAENQSIVIVLGHIGNWELAGPRFSLEPIHTLYVVYHPLSNPYFEKLVYRMRTRLGMHLYTMKNTFRGMVENRGQCTATAFIADQTPSARNTYWMEFLHQDTAVFTGPGRLAKRFKYPVVYIAINRLRRGKYRIESELLAEKPEALTEEQITGLYIRRLEKDIRARPESWLWTHRRWKRSRTPGSDGPLSSVP
ncbi:MAG: lysophospholipid acyltransferase family protein [Phaeodactylibacter sp.]|nr:lysophospholipid acyltransferase family protein [Phaeodactylibacter sp.]MCB9298101.1 lysophospholipid acyltransferase family protein [Lewinellaceae bacterium]